jgi:hypothetical protein
MSKISSQLSSLADPDKKRTLWDKTVVSTPIILTVVATVLAGISSSEMSNAQYYRSLAAQMQSKVSDQWGYYQAKRIRAQQCDSTLQILTTMTPSTPFDPKDLQDMTSRLADQMKQSSTVAAALAPSGDAVASLSTQFGKLPADQVLQFGKADAPTIQDHSIATPQIQGLLTAMDSHATSDADVETQAGAISQSDLDQAISVASDNSGAFETAAAQAAKDRESIASIFSQISQQVWGFERSARRIAADNGIKDLDPVVAAVHDLATQLRVTLTSAQLRFESNRQTQDARYNEVLAQLYEIVVHHDSFASDRHRDRSKKFFYGMLAAQGGVTIATFALALERRSWLWGLAASAGLAAVTFAAYVYMFV